VSTSAVVVHVEEAQLENRSLEIFRQYSDKRWSMVDCASFACIEQRRSDSALSYDRNFVQAQLEFNFQAFRP
jgi:predicted nucleic acid-binding protein